ncbi:citrate lyase beta chain [Escherichia coli]|nr:citrate lyase beta chain [Escherichia coli]
MISASLQQRKTRTRRSMLFVPGAERSPHNFPKA